MAGPTPHVNPGFEGEKKNDARMSLTPKAGSPAVDQRRLAHEGHDHSRDQIPVFVQRKRHHRLNVQDEARGVTRPDVLFPVELERHAHQIRNRIRQFLREFLGLSRRRCRWLLGPATVGQDSTIAMKIALAHAFRTRTMSLVIACRSRSYRPRLWIAKRRGPPETLITPSKGPSSSTIRNNAAATDTAAMKSTLTTVALRGA